MKLTGKERDDAIKAASKKHWFHSINFGDWTSPSRFKPGTTPNGTLLPVYHFLEKLDVKGKNCLDIGTADGIVAFTLKNMGAKHVLAADGTPALNFEVARDLLGLDVEYNPDIQDVDLGRKIPERSFDIVIMAGFIYHLFSPLSAIADCRKITRQGGIIIIETVTSTGDDPIATLNTEMKEPFTEQFSSYWIPTKSCVEGMLKLCCFDVLGTASLGKIGKVARVAYIARAVRPSEVGNKTTQLGRVFSGISGNPEINFRDLEKATNTVSIEYTRHGHIEIPSNADISWNKLQPVQV